jgi:dolichol-phosphate mannosyltransferase
MKIWILLPAFNEEESLPRLLPKIAKFCEESNYNYEIVVVNDGSLDNTSKSFRRVFEKNAD